MNSRAEQSSACIIESERVSERMQFLARILRVALLVLFIHTDICQSVKVTSQPLSDKDRVRFKTLAASSHDPNRQELVQSALRKAAGVYVDEEKSKSLELQSTVIMVRE